MPPASEIRIGAKVSQYVLRAPDQKSSQKVISRFCDGQLRTALSGIITARPQSKITADISTLLESMRIVKRQYKCQTGQCTYTMDLLDELSSRVLGSGQLLDLFVIGPDLRCERFQLVQQWEQGWL